VVVGRDGRVVAPAAWAAPESAGGAGVLVDAPVRHDFGAMGIEIELHDVRLFLPGGRRVPGGTVLLRSVDKLVRVVVDGGRAWLGADGILHGSRRAMQAAGVAAHPEAGSGGRTSISVPEMVTAPWAVLAETRPDLKLVLARLRDVNQRWGQAPVTRSAIPQESKSLVELFRHPDYVFTQEALDVQVVRLDGPSAPAPLYVQVSVGVPLGGGVLAALEDLRRGMDPSLSEAKVLSAAMEFGWDAARLYLGATAGGAPSPVGTGARTPDWDVADAVTVAEVMALAFVQLEGFLHLHTIPGGGIAKVRMPVVPRLSLYQIRAALGRRPREFFADQADAIRALFETKFMNLSPDYVQRYNTALNRTQGAPVDLWDSALGDLDFTAGQLCDEILRPDPEGERFGLDVFGIARADSDGLDRSGGGGPAGALPLVVLELRLFGLSKYPKDQRPELYGFIDYPMMMELIGRMTGTARRGEAAAAMARGLPASPEGQMVVTSLRQIAAEPDEAGRHSAALRRAVAAYQAQFPGEYAPLGMTLNAFARQFGRAAG
jgi:hypothetical protein